MKKRIKHFILSTLLITLTLPTVVLGADENTDANTGNVGGGGHQLTDEQLTRGGYTDHVRGIMFSVVDGEGNRLKGTKSYIIAVNSKEYYMAKRNGDIYYNKKETINDEGYLESTSGWKKRAADETVGDIPNFFKEDGNVVLNYLLKKKNKSQKYWQYYASKCGYKTSNYRYEEIQGHFLIFEPMTDINVGTGGGNNPYNRHFFGTYQQLGTLINYLYDRKGMYRESIAYITSTPVFTQLAPAIYMPSGTAGFNKGSKSQQSRTSFKERKANGDGIGSINIAESCGQPDTPECPVKPSCDININEHFPLDKNGNVQWVIIDSQNKYNVKVVSSDTKDAVNCCNELLDSKFGNDKRALCDARPECCYDIPCEPASEDKINTCTSNTNGIFMNPGKDDQDSWYCMKAFDNNSPYIEKIINQYARVVCREDLNANFPSELTTSQSVGSYMVWPTSSKTINNRYQLQFDGVMTCRLSIDKAEIEATGNAINIYNDIYNTVLSYTNNNTCDKSSNCEAKTWYTLNSRIKLALTYNDDEYGGVKISLTPDTSYSYVDVYNESNTPGYERLKNLMIKINKGFSYKLPDDTYEKLTTMGIGSKNLSNMYDKINKNEYVGHKFDYGILPISYKAKVSKNKSYGAYDHYKLTIMYSGIGNNSQFVIQEQVYTCPYEVTFAPPTNPDDNDDGKDTRDDNNEAYENADECYCNSNTAYKGMDLRGYLIKNEYMNCAEAQALYCNADRGNMNVEYRVISLLEPFPGIKGINYTLGGRDIGYNWRDNLERIKADESSIVKDVIINNRDVTSNQVYNLEPLYVIELDSAAIKTIREYNRKTTYADFEMDCLDGTNGKTCTSRFLKNYNLVKSGTCKNATGDKFYSCANKPKK